MSDGHHRRGHRRDRVDQQYPPITDEQDHPGGIPPSYAMSGGLPSMQDPHGTYAARWDTRRSEYGNSPTPSHGYPPPPSGYSPSSATSAYPPPGSTSLPPVQTRTHDLGVSYAPDGRAYYAAPPTSYEPANPYYQYGSSRDGMSYTGAPGGHGVIPQTAPRQRTSIACKYCRRRKIRCSGYQNAPGGKCVNCVKMHQECVFQPVSSSSSTAFVPVSALQNGIPPGTPLYGAYGQPLGGPPNAPSVASYDQPMPSPTGSYASFTDDPRAEHSRRRDRTSESEHARRLPPPGPFPDDNSRRRSPSSTSPGHLTGYYGGYDDRTPPPRGGSTGLAVGGSSASSVMSLENIMGSGSGSGNDIDKNMLGRLNRSKH
ncbi:hypothetical protein F4778DRAFT_704622 [Xylariomycetidae sp. FL2044]|nr:hypothetical protein F4778DRAFT_704622 [Xylariomycetidae sp. FL2044]